MLAVYVLRNSPVAPTNFECAFVPMLIIVLGWLYVLAMVAITAPSVWLGLFIFLGGGVAPALLWLYIAGGRIRRARRQHLERLDNPDSLKSLDSTASGGIDLDETRPSTQDADYATPSATVTTASLTASFTAPSITPPATPAPPSVPSSDHGDTNRSATHR